MPGPLPPSPPHANDEAGRSHREPHRRLEPRLIHIDRKLTGREAPRELSNRRPTTDPPAKDAVQTTTKLPEGSLATNG